MQSAEGILIRKIFCWSIDPKIMSLLAPTAQLILKFRDFLLTCSNRAVQTGQQQRLLTPLNRPLSTANSTFRHF
jgi:hypothetical protein